MYTIIYLSGKELKMKGNYKLSTMLDIANKNSSIYQIKRNNRDQEIVYEREALN